MNRRRLIALGCLAAALVLSGCFGSSEIPQDELSQDEKYDWETNATVAFTLDRSSFETVVNVTNQSKVRVYREDALGTERAVDLRALKFRYRNGTVVNASHDNLTAERTQERTKISVPARHGHVAYTADRSGKRFATPVFKEGDYEVTLPPNARVGIPLLSQVSPGGYQTTVSGKRMTIHWDDLEEGTIDVQYYLERDRLLFGLLLIVVLTFGVGGGFYYWRSIKHAREKREEIGLDIEEDDDPTDSGPPPGMR